MFDFFKSLGKRNAVGTVYDKLDYSFLETMPVDALAPEVESTVLAHFKDGPAAGQRVVRLGQLYILANFESSKKHSGFPSSERGTPIALYRMSEDYDKYEWVANLTREDLMTLEKTVVERNVHE